MDQVIPDFRLPNTVYSNKQNGRVALGNLPSAGGFLSNPDKGGFGYRTQVQDGADEGLLRGNWTTNHLSRSFFSPENIRTLQNTIKREVYEKSGNKWQIDDQDVDELQIVMRSLFLQYAKNLETDIPGQIRALNILVIDWCVPEILSNIKQSEHYIMDISTLPIPLDRSTLPSQKGLRTLEIMKL